MSKRGAWGPMAQRVQEGRDPVDVRQPEAEEAAAPVSEGAPAWSPVAQIKHCWVNDEHGRLPGLLLEWRRGEPDYRGRVVRPVLDEELGWVVVEEWLPAHLLGPA